MMTIQSQIGEWFGCAETIKEKKDIIKELKEVVKEVLKSGGTK